MVGVARGDVGCYLLARPDHWPGFRREVVSGSRQKLVFNGGRWWLWLACVGTAFLLEGDFVDILLTVTPGKGHVRWRQSV